MRDAPLSPPLGGQIDCERRHSAAGFDLALSFPTAFLRKTVHKREQLAVRVGEKESGGGGDTSQGRCSLYTAASELKSFLRKSCHVDLDLRPLNTMRGLCHVTVLKILQKFKHFADLEKAKVCHVFHIDHLMGVCVFS